MILGKWYRGSFHISEGNIRWGVIGVWRGILESEEVINKGGEIVVGKGDWVRFWEDKWLGSVALRFSFHLSFVLRLGYSSVLSVRR